MASAPAWHVAHPRTVTARGTDGPASQIRSVVLRGEPAAARAAREFTTGVLLGWGLPYVIDDAVLVASELVTNAVHAAPACGIEIAWQHCADRVICVVTDGAAGSPLPAEASPYAESGRGLQVVAALAVDWGWLMISAGNGTQSPCATLGPGKAVWAALAIPGR